jgi:hypothetical protein
MKTSRPQRLDIVIARACHFLGQFMKNIEVL